MGVSGLLADVYEVNQMLHQHGKGSRGERLCVGVCGGGKCVCWW